MCVCVCVCALLVLKLRYAEPYNNAPPPDFDEYSPQLLRRPVTRYRRLYFCISVTRWLPYLIHVPVLTYFQPLSRSLCTIRDDNIGTARLAKYLLDYCPVCVVWSLSILIVHMALSFILHDGFCWYGSCFSVFFTQYSVIGLFRRFGATVTVSGFGSCE